MNDQSTPQPENKGGRPTLYTPELRDEICRRLASGQTLRAVCRCDDMPDRVTIYNWLINNIGEKKDEEGKVVTEGFFNHYTRARDIGLDEIADETIEIADDSGNDFIEVETPGKNGAPPKVKIQFDKEHVQRSKLRVETRQRYMENMAPRKYGKNATPIQVQPLGKDGEPSDGFDGGGAAAAVLAAMKQAGLTIEEEA